MVVSRVVHLIGVILRVFGLTLVAPMAVSLWYGERWDALGFLVSGIGATAIGHWMRTADRAPEELRRADALVVVAGAWMIVAVAGAVPYVWVGVRPVDAMFESMSGLTTTGATIFEDFSRYGRGIFFWRALTHWLGGMGVIALFVAVFPKLAIAGRELFFAEASGPTDDTLAPQIRKTAAALWQVYAGLTLLQVIALLLAGMPVYDSVVHAFATLAAGGFSPHPQSIMGYASPAVEWICIVFMFLAGANFALHYRVIRGRPGDLWRDEEFRAYCGIIVVAAGLLTWFLVGANHGVGDAGRVALFQVVSIITTTGFASVDFQLWDDRSKFVLLVLMFVGGCAGSAAGGPKVVRQLLIARYTLLELRRTLHPRAVLPVKLGGRVVPDAVMRAVLVFFLFYLLIFAVCASFVAAVENDLIVGITGAIAALGNIGPGFDTLGPMASFARLHTSSKWVLIGAMWMGRLELMTVLVLLRPEVWGGASWRRAEPRSGPDVSGRE
jgi:trk system potassium uptake protein TrkH